MTLLRTSRRLALVGAATLLLAACGSGGSESPATSTPSSAPATGALEGKETGIAVGSTEKAPLDRSALDKGEQPELSTEATVLQTGTHAKRPAVTLTYAVTVTPRSVEEVEIDPSQWDESSQELIKDLAMYVVRYRVAYAGGPVDDDVRGASLHLYADGRFLDPKVSAFNAAVSKEQCGEEWMVKSFGVGAYYEGCQALLVPKDTTPTQVGWDGLLPGDAGVDPEHPQVLWPLS